MSTDESAFARLGKRELVQQMHDQLDEMLAARDQIEKLLHVILGISSDLDLPATLDRIVTAAIQLTHARYGALAIRAPDGILLSFLHQGFDDETVRRVGHLPVGKGLLGVPLEEAQALRLNDLREHPAAAGFPEHHPEMHAFLGVPITIRGTVFGSLYVTHERPVRTFSESDETAARVLALAAAVAIDNAQLFGRVQASAKWTLASREIATALLSGSQAPTKPLHVIAARAMELTEAEQAIVLIPDSDPKSDDVETLVVSAAVGVHAEEVFGQRIPVDGSTSGAVFRSGEPIITESFRHPIAAFTDVGQRPAILMPLRADDLVVGVIAVARSKDDPAFDPSYLDLVSDFATHAAIALTLASARNQERELTILADRERIAHDLHDHVIQRLFAAGLDLQGSIARSRSPEINDRLSRTVDDLQETIETIRTTIFDLQFAPTTADNLRGRLQKLVADLTDDRGVATSVRLSGPVGAVTGQLSDHAQAVAAEAISNAVRHSGAAHISVSVAVSDEFSLEVTDDGRGIPADNRRSSGLTNMQRRAELLGGICEITSVHERGTTIRWIVPVFSD